MSQFFTICDSERMTFLRALDNADFEVTNWEAEFIAKALKYQTTSPAFSDKQREVIDKMWRTYSHQL